MNFFKQKLNVCSECKMAFEPATGYEAKWNDLCSVHRKPLVEQKREIDRVVLWAMSNPKEARVAMDLWEAKEREGIDKYPQMQRGHWASAVQMQGSQMQGSYESFGQTLWGNK